MKFLLYFLLLSATAYASTSDPGSNFTDEDWDGDGLLNDQEALYNTYPNNAYSDADLVIDGEDGWALDPDLSPPRLPEPHYAAIDLSQYGLTSAFVVSDNLDVVYWDGAIYTFGLFSLKTGKHATAINFGIDLPSGFSSGGRLLGTDVGGAYYRVYLDGNGTLQTSVVAGSAGGNMEAFSMTGVNDGSVIGDETWGDNQTTWHHAGRMWTASVPTSLGTEETYVKVTPDPNHETPKLTSSGVQYMPDAINNTGDIGAYRTFFSAGPVGGSWGSPEAGVLAEGSFSTFPDSSGVVITGMNNADPLAVTGFKSQYEDEYHRLWIKTPSGYKEKSAGYWIPGKDLVRIHSVIAHVNDRYEVAGKIYNDARGDVAGIIRNTLVSYVTVNDVKVGVTWVNNNGVLSGGAVYSGVYKPMLLVPIEIKVVDRDDPKKKWGDEKYLAGSKPIYSGESCGDMVSFKLAGTDSWTSLNWTWTATGPDNETINGPAGAGKNEWKIADGDQDTSVDWVKWKPGKWKIKAQAGAISMEFDQEIATRTEQYFCIGTIPFETPPATGVLQRVVDQWACGEIQKTLARVPGGGVNNPVGDHFIPKDEVNRVYVIHRLLDSTANSAPLLALKPEKGLSEACGLDSIMHYRFFAGCQFKFKVNGTMLAAPPEFVRIGDSEMKADLIGFTPFPCQDSYYAGAKGESNADSGKVMGPDGKSASKANDTEFSFITKNRVGKMGQNGWNVILGRQMPWVFFRFRFKSKDDGLLDTRFENGPSINPDGPDATNKDYSLLPNIYVYRRYYDLPTSAWKLEQLPRLIEQRRPFMSIGAAIPAADYLIP